MPDASYAANTEIEPNDTLTIATPMELNAWYMGEMERGS